MRFAHGSVERRFVMRIDLAAGKCDLSGMIGEVWRALGQQHGRLRPVDDADQHSGRARRDDAGPLPLHRIEFEVAAHRRYAV